MALDRSLFGKMYVDYDRVLVITGYDFFAKEYLARSYSKNKLYYHENYLVLNSVKAYIEKYKSADEVKTEVNQKLEKIKEILDWYDRFSLKCSKYEARNTMNRLIETKRNIKCLEHYAENMKPVWQADFYKKELKKSKKGLRRVYKVLHSRLSKEDYDYILNLVEEKPDLDFYKLKKKKERYEKLLEMIDEISKLEVDFDNL